MLSSVPTSQGCCESWNCMWKDLASCQLFITVGSSSLLSDTIPAFVTRAAFTFHSRMVQRSGLRSFLLDIWFQHGNANAFQNVRGKVKEQSQPPPLVPLRHPPLTHRCSWTCQPPSRKTITRAHRAELVLRSRKPGILWESIVSPWLPKGPPSSLVEHRPPKIK